MSIRQLSFRAASSSEGQETEYYTKDSLKETVHPKMKNLLFTYPHSVPNLYKTFSSMKHKERKEKKLAHKTCELHFKPRTLCEEENQLIQLTKLM